jgi:hypothetical protein
MGQGQGGYDQPRRARHLPQSQAMACGDGLDSAPLDFCQSKLKWLGIGCRHGLSRMTFTDDT